MKEYVSAYYLRTWQQERGLTNVEMCQLLKVGLCTYSRWRNERQPTPRWLPYRLDQLTEQYERQHNGA